KVGEFIEKGYRTARRHTGAYITITQNIVDFDSDKASSAARAAWGNSSYKIILKQSAKEFAKYNQLYRAEDRAERLALVACLLAVIPALNLATSDAAAVAGLVMTVLTVGLVSCAGKSLPRFWPGDFFPTFYACHLAVLGVLAL
ncbi:TPA: TraX family protein, partial [Escherichia coli]